VVGTMPCWGFISKVPLRTVERILLSRNVPPCPSYPPVRRKQHHGGTNPSVSATMSQRRSRFDKMGTLWPTTPRAKKPGRSLRIT
jgi:hypothetical protein